MARHGENIHKRKDGRWEARVITGYKDNGKANYQSIYGTSYDEVKKKKEHLRLGGKVISHNSIPFDRAAEEWLSYRKGKVKQSTYNHYFNQYQLHIRPVFEGKNLNDIKKEDYDSFVLAKENEGYSARTVLLLRTILKMILKYAERKNYIVSVNDIYMPRKPSRNVEAFTRKEQALVDNYLKEHPDFFSNAIAVSLYCGLRIGEVCALQWKDIDLDQGILTVSKTMIRVQNKTASNTSKTEVVMQKPKTESSSRRVPVPSHIVNYIKENFERNPEEFIITGTDHGMEPRVCLRKFKKIMNSLNLGNYTFHACRHTYATRCVELGIDAKILSELLGHSSVKITLDRYVHPSMDFKKEQVEKLAQFGN